MSHNVNSNDGQTSSTPKKFDIRDHLDKLEPGKAKNYYTCPVCEGHSLGINSKNGKYQCWTNACSTADIREAIRPLAEFLAECKEDNPASQAKKPKAKKKEYRPVPVPIGAKLLRLPAPGKPPRAEQPKYVPKGVPDSATQITYAYSDTQKVLRFDWPDASKPKGRDKTCRQIHIDPSGKEIWSKGDARWPAYRIDEVVQLLEALPDDEPVLVLALEGENNVELARDISVAALTLQGSNWSHVEIQIMLETLQATGKNVAVAVLRDNDDAGIKKSQEVWLVARHIQLPCVVVDPRVIHPKIPEAGDIREILEAIDSEEFIRRVEEAVNNVAAESITSISLTPHPRTREEVVCQKYDSSESDYIPDTAPTPEQNYVQKAVDALYSDKPWVSIAGQLFEFTGTHYELRSEAAEKRRILDWLSTYSELVKGKYRCNRFNSASANEVYNCMVLAVAVDPNTINPDGLNSSKGIVKINPDGSHSLVPHNPNQVYTYVGCKYDPDIDPTDCDRLLECLEPSQREVFLRTAAAALNLKLVRSKLTGRGVKGLLCHGEGSNGKDTLRAVLSAVFGRGMTGKSLSDFKSYDNGRKFSLAGIEGSICNWASENTGKIDLDTIQSLKQLITGDILDIERKGKDGYEYKPAAIFLANCNKLPSITGGTAAIDDRYSILSFEKTYKHNADPSQGELEADPRFKDDENFILERIAPAMLNKMLERLPLLLKEGIDYKATREAMREAQEGSRHLWQFAREVGLEVQSGGRVWLKDLWQKLQNWYEDAGILERETSGTKEKLIWNELPSKYDAPVKAINQLYSRLCEIFPKVQVHRCEDRNNPERRGQKYLLGINFVQSSTTAHKTGLAELAVDTAMVTGLASGLASELAKNTANPVANPQTLTQRAANSANPISSPFAEVCNLLSQLTDDERRKLAELLVKPQPLVQKVTPEDAQAMRDIALVWWHEYYPEQLQTLQTQMFGWQAPGKKYDIATIAQWLEGEVEAVRDRIAELIRLQGEI
ncbi:hypothetical protein Osc7112_4949 [Oscillatoria nigro-viridis PCC 7112]|uniref:SF3 helicase domain-containing protein n=1 Tax=Phormidium nigroviride PCC 7112 TaxID=179408 RepID=K9VPQ8_9CYAN|nr:DUF5906 domain-containing protein [Oscillatoria nigro-viridis]AFZ09215.1 hypothetical protein Osc7112_4949 [Oscillatoria nigro-viridis PCC 7112]